MKNQKVIVLCGWARGGTNLAWNLLQSHPGICSPVLETGELLRRDRRLLAGLVTPMGKERSRRLVDARLFEHKLETLRHPDNRFVAPGELYSEEAVAGSALCLKSVSYEIFLTRRLLKIYPDLYVVALTREGRALCSGHVRRGRSAAAVGRSYRRVGHEMLRLEREHDRFVRIRFEDITRDPFAVAAACFEALDLQPSRLEQVRLKAKRVVDRAGAHETTFGAENRKYWFTPTTVQEIVQPGIDAVQRSQLTEPDRRAFDRAAGTTGELLGYER